MSETFTDEEIEKRKDELVLNGTKDQRKAVFEQDFFRFAFYYFREFFFFDTPDFHHDMLDDIEDMQDGVIKEIIWCMFRESGKTSLAQIYVIWIICNRKKKFINVDSYDKDNAESFIFDIANYLMENEKLISDYGNIYQEDHTTSMKRKEMKRVDKFITTTDIRVEAFSTQTSTRGRKHKHIRPDFFILDDFETSKTAVSWPITKKVIDHIDEIRGGIGQGVNVIYLCNYVTESGSVQHLKERAKEAESMRWRKVDIEMNGQITWPSKFVRTKAEAIKINSEIKDQKKWVMSIEEKKETLGETEYQKNMMNNPSATQEVVFDRVIIERLIENAKLHTVKKETAGLKQWEEYNAKHRYAQGGDTSEGVGRDSNTTSTIDFSRKPALVVATYANNQIAPDTFAFEQKRHALLYGECFIATEINNTGFATITQLRAIYPTDKMYKRIRTDLVTKKITKELGWKTTSATKTEIIYQFKSAVENGELEIWDVDLLEECKYFNQGDLKDTEYKEGMTKHYDKLMATAIAWEMRNHAQVAEPVIENKNKNYKQKEYLPSSLYQSRG